MIVQKMDIQEALEILNDKLYLIAKDMGHSQAFTIVIMAAEQLVKEHGRDYITIENVPGGTVISLMEKSK